MNTCEIMSKTDVGIDKQLLRQRFCAAIATYDAHASIQKKMAIELVQLAQPYLSHKQSRILELGCGTGLMTREILRLYTVDHFTANDLVDQVEKQIKKITIEGGAQEFDFVGGDVEKLTLPGDHQSIWSGATIQWVSDLKMFFAKMNHLLQKDGYLVVSSFGTDNYREIRELTGQGIKYKSLPEIFEAIGDQFEVLETKEWQEIIWFKTPREVLTHMRHTGVNGLSSACWTRKDLNCFMENYNQMVQLEGYPLTYHPLLLVLKKK